MEEGGLIFGADAVLGEERGDGRFFDGADVGEEDVLVAGEAEFDFGELLGDSAQRGFWRWVSVSFTRPVSTKSVRKWVPSRAWCQP